MTMLQKEQKGDGIYFYNINKRGKRENEKNKMKKEGAESITSNPFTIYQRKHQPINFFVTSHGAQSIENSTTKNSI